MEDKTLQEYHLPKRKLVYALSLASLSLALSPVILHIVFSGKYTGNTGSWIPVTLIFGFFAVWAFQWGYRSKLVITPNGIEIHDIANLLSVKTEWANVTKIETFGSRIMLILKKPANPASKLSAWLFSKGFINPVFVDISDYREYWQNGDLRTDFTRYISALLRDA